MNRRSAASVLRNLYVCKIIVPINGVHQIIRYIGPWNGWKKIDRDASVMSWRGA